MRISELLKVYASWLESEHNEAFMLAEYNDPSLKIVTQACVHASEILKKAAEEVDSVEPEFSDEDILSRRDLGFRMLDWHGGQGDPVYAVGSFYVDNKVYPKKEVVEDALGNLSSDLSQTERMLNGESVMVSRQGRQVDLRQFAGYSDKELTDNIEDLTEITESLQKYLANDYQSVINEDSIDELGALAQAFDDSGDEFLKKQASVIDEILMTIAAPSGLKAQAARIENSRIEELKKKYNQTNTDLKSKLGDSIEAVKKSPMYKQYRPLEAPLKTRYCPDHAGVMASRIAEDTYQCELDGKTYNYAVGFKTDKGKIVPGTSVENQSQMEFPSGENNFETRESRLSR